MSAEIRVLLAVSAIAFLVLAHLVVKSERTIPKRKSEAETEAILQGRFIVAEMTPLAKLREENEATEARLKANAQYAKDAVETTSADARTWKARANEPEPVRRKA